MIVIDLGCFPHDGRDSSRELVEKYRPELLLGFDPLVEPGVTIVDGVPAAYSQTAAWTNNGKVGFYEDGLASRVGEGTRMVECFDLVSLIKIFPDSIVKLDVEGAEYALLEHLNTKKVWPSSLLIEWHEEFDLEGRQQDLLRVARCPVQEWWM